MGRQGVRVSCDSLVALGSSTADGNVLFAKNSDRPALECQPLQLVPAATHAAGDRLRCTYIEIPQAAATFRVIGSRPYWCWGFEHGVNERGVAIGNHTVFTRDVLVGDGLIGMDLVRLGLERAATARDAASVITGLLEQFGQGGSGYGDKQWPYHNSFLIADRESAFVLETSDVHWALRRVRDIASVSNHLTIGTDWDDLSSGAVAHAHAAGWVAADPDERFDFAGAYRDIEMAPPVISSGRHGRSCSLLEAERGHLSIESLRRDLRDHYGSAWPNLEMGPIDERYFSLCMHADPVGTTTASVIAALPRDTGVPLIYHASLGSPCVGIFLPLFVDGELPEALTRGGEQADDSAWWTMKRLLLHVEQDWPSRFPGVRKAMDELEGRIAAKLPLVVDNAKARNQLVADSAAELVELATALTQG